MATPNITILGVGNILLSDEGFGVRVIQALYRRYAFDETVRVIDGNVMGLNLLGVVTEADHLVVIDAVKNKGIPGTLYRIDGEDIPRRILAKNSIHQVDLLETLTLSRVLDKMPETVIFGVEPEDITTLSTEMTPAVRAGIEPMIERVLAHLDSLGISYSKRSDTDHVSCDSLQDCPD